MNCETRCTNLRAFLYFRRKEKRQKPVNPKKANILILNFYTLCMKETKTMSLKNIQF